MSSAVLLTLVVAMLAPLVGAGNGGAEPDGVGAARATLESARSALTAAEQRLADAEAAKAALQAEIAGLEEGAAQITVDLAAARRAVREYAVAAYIDGGQAAMLEATLDVEQRVALAWRTHVVGTQTAGAATAVDRFTALKAANDPERMVVAQRLDVATAAAEEAHSDALKAAAHERDAESAVARAEAAAADRRRIAAASAAEAQQRREAAARAATTTTTTAAPAQAPPTAPRSAARASRPAASGAPAPTALPRPAPQPAPPPAPPTPQPAPTPPAPAPTRSGNPTAGESGILAGVRRCESGGNYGIVSGSGAYRGAYQFDRRTWAAVGGSGDPAAASPAEQDYRALLLLRQRGRRPWPNCA